LNYNYIIVIDPYVYSHITYTVLVETLNHQSINQLWYCRLQSVYSM